jgi:signal peptidase II
VSDSTSAPEAHAASPRYFGLSVALTTLVLDQLSKLWILLVVRLEDTGPWPLTPFMEFVMVWNRGISYGLFQQSTDIGRWILVILSFVASIWLSRWMWREPRKGTVLGLALVIGGAIGNGIDRAVYGAVADFVHLFWNGWSWYVFNIADAAIVVGVALLIYDTFKSGREAR